MLDNEKINHFLQTMSDGFKNKRLKDDSGRTSSSDLDGSQAPSGAATPAPPTVNDVDNEDALFDLPTFGSAAIRGAMEQYIPIKNLVDSVRKELEPLLAYKQPLEALKIMQKFCKDYIDIATADNTPSLLKLSASELFFPFESDFEAPTSRALKTILEHAYCVAHQAHVNTKHNFSGYAFSGPRGIGKSSTLKLAVFLASLMFPNFIAVYVDLTKCATSTLSVFDLIATAATDAAVFPLGSRFTKFNKNVSKLISHIHNQKFGFGIFLDELRHIYLPEPWLDLHEFVTTGCATSLIVADSCTAVADLIRGQNFEHIQALLSLPPTFNPLRSGMPLPSLNGTKVKIENFTPLRTPPEYIAYLKFLEEKKHIRLPPAFKSLDLANRTVCHAIRKLHLYSNGILRNIDSLLPKLTAPDHFNNVKSQYPNPRSDQALYRIFQELARHHRRLLPDDVTSASFQLPKLSRSEITKIIAEYEPTTNPYRAMARWVEIGLLHVDVEANANYTYGLPAYFMMTLQSCPSIFLSHAFEGEEFMLEIQDELEKLFVDAVGAKDSPSQIAISFIGLRQFEERQIERQEHVAILFDAMYAAKVRDASKASGARREFFKIVRRWYDSFQAHQTVSVVIISRLVSTEVRQLVKAITSHFQEHPQQLVDNNVSLTLEQLETFFENVISYSVTEQSAVNTLADIFRRGYDKNVIRTHGLSRYC
jgi:hypothetical protein